MRVFPFPGIYRQPAFCAFFAWILRVQIDNFNCIWSRLEEFFHWPIRVHLYFYKQAAIWRPILIMSFNEKYPAFACVKCS